MASIKNIESFCNLIKSSNVTDSNNEIFADFYYLINNSDDESFTNNLTLVSSDESLISPTNLTYMATLCNQFNNRISQSRFNYVRYNLIKFAYLIISLFGIFGNTLSIYVMIKKYKSSKKTQNKYHNFSFILAMLCGTDLAILLFGALREYFEEIHAFNLRSHSIYTCKFFFFVCYLFSSFSVWLYTFIAFERWHAVSNPIKYKQKDGKKNQKLIILIFVSCSFISLPFLLGSSLQESIVPKNSRSTTIDFEVKCEISTSWYVKLTILDFLFYNCAPFLLAFLFSNLTLFQLIKFHSTGKNRREKMNELCNDNYDQLIKSYELGNISIKNESNISQSRTNQFKIIDNDRLRSKNHLPLDSNFFQTDININENSLNSAEFDTKKKAIPFTRVNSRLTSKFKITMMLMAFPISYILTTAPAFVFITLQLLDNFFRQESESNYETEFVFSKTIMYLNNSMNVLFFILFELAEYKEFCIGIYPFISVKSSKKTQLQN